MRRGPDEHRHTPVRRYHLHAPGLVYLLVTVFLAIGAINGQNNLLFAAFGLAVAGLLFSGVVSGSMMIGLDVRRRPLDSATAGNTVSVGYDVRNTGRRVPAFALVIDEMGPAHAPPLARTHCPYVGARGSARARAPLTARRRGLLRLNSIRVWSTFPFGLVRKSVTFADVCTLVVFPADLRLREGAVQSPIAAGVVGDGDSRRRGQGGEFYGLREYQHGDPMRRVAWRPSARAGVLLSRVPAAPAPRRLWVLLAIDPASSDDLAESAVALAASVLRGVHAQGTAVGLVVAGTDIVRRPAAGPTALLDALTDLALFERNAPFRAGAGAIPADAPRRDGVVVVSAGVEPDADLRGRSLVLDASRIEQLIEPGQTLPWREESP